LLVGLVVAAVPVLGRRLPPFLLVGGVMHSNIVIVIIDVYFSVSFCLFLYRGRRRIIIIVVVIVSLLRRRLHGLVVVRHR
jgi:hypothetical protein